MDLYDFQDLVLYEAKADDLINQLSPQACGAMEQVLNSELERTVTHLERILDTLTNDANYLINKTPSSLKLEGVL